MNSPQTISLGESPADTNTPYPQAAQEQPPLVLEEGDALAPLIPYQPHSRAPYKIDTLIPRNLAFEVDQALSHVTQRQGSPDHFVRDQLFYPDTDALHKALAAEQIDSLALYLFQFGREKGIIIGDQTGVGKGRQAAAIIRHAVLQGYLPVFFTRKPDLFTDIYRDLEAIGSGDLVPFILNTDANASIKDARGHVLHTPLGAAEQKELLQRTRVIPIESEESIAWHRARRLALPDPEKQPHLILEEPIDTLPAGYQCILSTYSQVQAAQPFKRQWLQALCKAGIEGSRKHPRLVFVLDESHMAGGYDSLVGHWMRMVLPSCKAAAYLSATFAKYPEAMPLYAPKTAIGDAGMREEYLVYNLNRGGLALQEIIAAHLASSGQLMRRQRSMEGVHTHYHVLDQEPARSLHREQTDQLISLMNDIVAFDEAYIRPVIADLHLHHLSWGRNMKHAPRNLGVMQAPYFSRVFNVVDQLLFALKVEEVVKLALRLLHEDKKVVIAFKSTMGSFLQDLNLSSGDLVAREVLDFGRTLRKGLDNLFAYNVTDIKGNKRRERLSIEVLDSEAKEDYEKLVARIAAMDTGLFASPIDLLIHQLERAPKPARLKGHGGKRFRVAEVTGRSQRLLLQEEGSHAQVQAFRSNTEKAFREFNEGEVDVLLINQSGSTGSSAHASKDFKDQRQRAMIIHQFELDINTEVQKRGRIHRTGQVVLPEYHYVTTDIPTEKRLLSMLKGKLKSLDANTTGSQHTNDEVLRSPDFFNKYGDEAAWLWCSHHRDLMERLGWPTWTWEVDRGVKVRVREKSAAGAVRKVTSRIGLLSVEEQEQAYTELLATYADIVHFAKQEGTYDLEAEYMPLEADTKRVLRFAAGSGLPSIFGRDTLNEFCVVNNHRKPMRRHEIEALLVQNLKGQKPAHLRHQQREEVRATAEAWIARQMAEATEEIDAKKALLKAHEAAQPAEEADEETLKRWKEERKRKQRKVAELKTRQSFMKKDFDEQLTLTLKYLDFWKVGDVTKVDRIGRQQAHFGVFLGLRKRYEQAENPIEPGNLLLVFATTDERRLIQFDMTKHQRTYFDYFRELDEKVTQEEKDLVWNDWDARIKASSQVRERRNILTGNLLSVAGIGRLIRYNTNTGARKHGVLMSRDFTRSEKADYGKKPIIKALEEMQKLPFGKKFKNDVGDIRFERLVSDWEVKMRRRGKNALYTDPQLRGLLLPDPHQDPDTLPEFVQQGNDLVGHFGEEKLEAFLALLSEKGITYLGKADELEDWEIRNQEEWEAATGDSGRQWSYQLTEAFGADSQPQTGFAHYSEPEEEAPFGKVHFKRELTPAERINYGLIPVFERVQVPVLAWLASLDEQGAQALEAHVANQAGKPLHEQIMELGVYMNLRPHEPGNPEFVFGNYSRRALGRALYQERVGEISLVRVFEDQLGMAMGDDR